MPELIARILPKSVQPAFNIALGNVPAGIAALLPRSAQKVADPLIGATELVAGALTTNPSLITSGASTIGQGLTSDFSTDKLQLPQVPKFGGGAAPSLAPPPPDFPVTPGSGLSPTSGFNTPSATAGPGGGDFSAAIAQALAQILGPGGQLGSPQSGDAFSGQFGGQ